jgi:hypothetical protein
VITVAVQDIAGQTAHALPHDFGKLSVAFCGFLGDYLTVLPNVSWDDVPLATRCEHCDAAVPKPWEPSRPAPLAEPYPAVPFQRPRD